jgi:hypothetical protein
LSWDRFSETRFGDFKLPAGSGRPAGISKALSLDLRSRVLAAIFGGLSSRQAAERFGVSASSAIRWRARQREQGDARPKAALIGSLVDETPDITLDEFRAALADRAFFGRLRHVVARLFNAKRSRAKKTAHAAEQAWPDILTASGVVRGPVRSRPRLPPALRRDLSLDQHGPAPRSRAIASPGAKGSHRRDRRAYQDVLSERDRELIEHVCAREMTEFGYKW